MSARLFIALPVDEPITLALYDASSRLGDAWRRTRPAAMHLTLAFLGDVEETKIPDAVDAMKSAAAASAPLDLRAEGLGAFPNERQANLAWAGIAGEAVALRSLQATLVRRLASNGFELADRVYRPHVTLARVRGQASLPADRDREQHFGSWRAAEVQLIESHLGKQGSRYEVRATARLGRDPASH